MIKHRPNYMSLLACLAMLACGRTQPHASRVLTGGGTVGEFKGYYAINQVIRQRLIAPAFAEYFNLGSYIGDDNASHGDISGLAGLLGGFRGQGATNSFRNGQPNAMNMLLWNMALSRLADEASRVCDASAKPNHGSFTDMGLATGPHVASVKPLCFWPAAEAKKPELLANLWYAVMGYEAPDAELSTWQDSLLSPTSPFAGVKGTEAVRGMLKAIFLNPIFLLEE